MSVKQNWLQLTIVQAGGAICLPVFVIGFALGKNDGIASAFLSIVLGNIFLLVLAMICGLYSSQKKLSTIECAIQCFGRKGKILFSAAIVCSMTGWYAIQLNLMGESLNQLFPFDCGVYGTVAMGAVMTILARRGIQGVGLLATISLPLLIATIAIGVYDAVPNSVESFHFSKITTSGVSLVLACSIAAVIDLPSFFKDAGSQKDAMVSIVLLFGLVIPVVEGVGVILSSSFGEGDFLSVLMGQNPSKIWQFWVLGFVLLAGWTTNSANLYSAAVSLEPIFYSASFAKRAALVGGVGSVFACFPLMEGLELILEPIGVVLASMGAVLIVYMFTQNYTTAVHHFICWMAGVVVGMSGLIYKSVSGIPILDAFFVSSLTLGIIVVFSTIKQERVGYENN